MANWIIQQYADLGEGINADQKRMDIMPIAYPGDDRAHVWQVTVTKNGEPFNVESGHTVEAYFFREYDGQSPMATGTIVGSVCSVALPQEAYAYPCRVTGIMRLSTSGSGEVTTIGVISFHVGENLTGVIIDPGEAIPSIDNLLAEIHRMEVANSYTETFEFRVLGLEKATTGAWYPPMEVGGISTSTGANTSSTNASGKARSRSTSMIPYVEGQTVAVEDGYLYMILYYDSEGAYTGVYEGWYSTEHTIKNSVSKTVNNQTVTYDVGYFRLLVRNSNITDFTGVPNTFITVGQPGSMESRMNVYSNIHDKPESIVNSFARFGSATLNDCTVTLTNGGDGIRTAYFEPELNTVNVQGTITFNTPTIAAWLCWRDTDNGNHYEQLTNVSLASGEPFAFSFDAAYYPIYGDGNTPPEHLGNGVYAIMFNAPSGESEESYPGTTITVNELTIYNPNDFQSAEYYDDTLPSMMTKVFDGIDGARDAANRWKNRLLLTAPDGSKFSLGVDENHELVLLPFGVPNRVLFVGNSLLLGMNRGNATSDLYVYGMCATDHTKDYYWRVKEAILDVNGQATFKRLFGQPLEILGTSGDFDDLWSTEINEYTGQPMSASFTADLDLIIIQLGDNANNDDLIEALEDNIPSFIANIQAASPNARIIWVEGWFNRSHSAINRALNKLGIEHLYIHDLRAGHTAVSGQSYETGSGGTATVKDLWITHPGDSGFALIAEAIIAQIGL